MIRGSIGVLACTVLVAQSAQAPRVFRSATDAVRVDVLVTDGHKPIGGLTTADFDVRDSGVAQTVEAVQIVDVPFSMLLALDTSSSMSGPPLKELQEAARAAVNALEPDDRASVMTFTHRISAASPWQHDRRGVQEAIDGVRAGGATSLFDAAVSAFLRRDPEPGRRNLVILFTDGADTASWLPDAAALELAARTDAVVYCVAIDGERRAGVTLNERSGIRIMPRQPIISSADFLAELSGRTGGESLATTVGNLRRVFQRIVQDFRTRYVLTYVPKGVPESGWHPIDVQVKSRRVHVTARRGYER